MTLHTFITHPATWRFHQPENTNVNYVTKTLHTWLIWKNMVSASIMRHTSLTATAGSKKLTSQTEHIPALCRCRESVPTQKSNHIGGRFRDHHFCLYFELGCELGPSEAHAQYTSKNDDFKNGPLFDLIFVWELILDTYRGLGYAQFGWSIFLNRRLLVKRCG